MLTIEPITLTGFHLELEPLNESHKNELYDVAQDERIWRYIGTTAFGEQFHNWFTKALENFRKSKHLPFVVRRLSDQKIIGSTRFYEINPEHHRLTIGYTWYIPEVWGSYINPECKFLLLQFAFETLQVNRVEFMTDARNLHSRAAIKKLGAIEEGTLRQHMILKDFIRDTVVYSIIKSDWPLIKINLQTRFGI